MRLDLFIAKRIISNKLYKNSVSAPIIKIGVFAIALGIVVMMISVATGIGLQNKIREKITAFNGHVVVKGFDYNDSDETEEPIKLSSGILDSINLIQGVSYSQGVASKFGVIKTNNDFEGVVFKGVDESYNYTLLKEYLIQGRIPSTYGEMSSEILISSYTLNRLNLNLGDSFQMYFSKSNINKLPFIRKFKIVGVFNSGFNEIDEKFIIGDISHIRFFNKWKNNEVGSYEVFFDDFSELTKINNKIYNLIPSEFNSIPITQFYRSIFDWVKIFDNNIYTIIVIMLIVAGINMITALLVLILERIHMIGILKALGAKNWLIRKVFIYNALYLVGKGLLWGNFIGLSLLFIQKYFSILKFPNPEQYYMTVIPVEISLYHLIVLNIGTIISCFTLLLVPSFIISKISVVKAVRFN